MDTTCEGCDQLEADLKEATRDVVSLGEQLRKCREGTPAESVLPIIHMNGTSREALVEQVAHAGVAVQEAIRFLAQACPNGRDYYPEPGRFEKAMAQHGRRQKILRDLYLELEAEALAIDELQ